MSGRIFTDADLDKVLDDYARWYSEGKLSWEHFNQSCDNAFRAWSEDHAKLVSVP